MTDVTRDGTKRYKQPPMPLFQGERELLDRFVRPGMRVLDVGCGYGRVTGPLLHRGARVCACDLNLAVLRQLQTNLASESTAAIIQADARSLPFKDRQLDVVLFAFNAIDMVFPETARIHVLQEIERVLRPGGYFIFSSHNPLGTVVSPRGLRSWTSWRVRLRHLLSGAFRQTYFRDEADTVWYQALPRSVIRQVSEQSGMAFRVAVNRSGTLSSLAVISLL